jgi:hypothetical protein
MNVHSLRVVCAALVAMTLVVIGFGVHAAPPLPVGWWVVVNNGDFMPTDTCDPAPPLQWRSAAA